MTRCSAATWSRDGRTSTPPASSRSGRAQRRQRDGGPRVDKPVLQRLNLDAVECFLDARRALSRTTSRTRCLRRTARSSRPRSSPSMPTSASRGTATPTGASSSTREGEFVPGDFVDGAAGRGCSSSASGRDDHLRPPRLRWAMRGHRRSRAAGRADEPRRARVHQARGCARSNAVFGGEVTGHYYFRDFSYADSGIIPALRDARAALASGKALSALVGGLPRALSVSGEINSTRRRTAAARSSPGCASATRSARASIQLDGAVGRSTRIGTSTCARRTPSP